MKNCNEVIQGLPELIAGPAQANGAQQPANEFGTLRPTPVERYLREGCYLLKYMEGAGLASVFYGTMRVDHQLFGTRASGDLYFHQGFGRTAIPTVPNPGAGIPIFPIAQYSYYLRVTNILHGRTTADHFTLAFEKYQYDSATQSWTNLGTYRAEMYWRTAPDTYPSEDFYLGGDVLDAFGHHAGNLSMGWVDSSFRRATVEVDRVSRSPFPGSNGDGVDWESVFEGIGWEMEVIESEIHLEEPGGASWTLAELHASMLAERDLSNLDTEWRYHLHCVREIEYFFTLYGIMFDAAGTDSNHVPREGAAINSGISLPSHPDYDPFAGMLFGEAQPFYFRTAVHEIGHAMGLSHISPGTGFMGRTGDIAAAPGTLLEAIYWNFSSLSIRRLNHWPDICVRPGGASFGRCHAATPISPFLYHWPTGLVFRVAPLVEAVPIGAPVRVNIALENTSDKPIVVPKSLSLAASSVKGKVATPCGAEKGFQSIYKVDGIETMELAPGKTLSHDLTLLRGADGALFAGSGLHKITVEVEWKDGAVTNQVAGACQVMVTPPADEAHAKVATKLLTTPEVHLVLILGGDHLKEGIEAIQLALKNKVLRPHYAVIEAKRLGKRFWQRKADIAGACKLIDKATVFSASEANRLLEMLQPAENGQKGQVAPPEVVSLLKKMAKGQAALEPAATK